MDGPLSQIVALTIHGNAFLSGAEVPQFFPTNTTCMYVEFVRFAEQKRSLFGKAKELTVAATPDEWIASLPARRATGIRLLRKPHNDPVFTDRMSAGLVGGGGTWMMEVLRNDGQSEFWAARWVVGDEKAQDRRSWRVTYLLLGTQPTRPYSPRALSTIRTDLRAALTDIHAFAVRQKCEDFAPCFANALTALDNPDADLVATYKDLAPPGFLERENRSLLNAATLSWVFGAMGSWNDMGFQGTVQPEYDNVSDRLFDLLSETIATSASSTAPKVSASK